MEGTPHQCKRTFSDTKCVRAHKEHERKMGTEHYRISIHFAPHTLIHTLTHAHTVMSLTALCWHRLVTDRQLEKMSNVLYLIAVQQQSCGVVTQRQYKGALPVADCWRSDVGSLLQVRRWRRSRGTHLALLVVCGDNRWMNGRWRPHPSSLFNQLAQAGDLADHCSMACQCIRPVYTVCSCLTLGRSC